MTRENYIIDAIQKSGKLTEAKKQMAIDALREISRREERMQYKQTYLRISVWGSERPDQALAAAFVWCTEPPGKKFWTMIVQAI